MTRQQQRPKPFPKRSSTGRLGKNTNRPCDACDVKSTDRLTMMHDLNPENNTRHYVCKRHLTMSSSNVTVFYKHIKETADERASNITEE